MLARSHRSRRRVAAGGARAEYRNFFGETLSTLRQSWKARLSQRIDQGMMRRAPVAVHILRIDDWMTIIRCTHEGWRDARRTGRARFPLMTQWTKPSGAEGGVNDGRECPAKNFDTQRIPSLQPLVDELRAGRLQLHRRRTSFFARTYCLEGG